MGKNVTSREPKGKIVISHIRSKTDPGAVAYLELLRVNEEILSITTFQAPCLKGVQMVSRSGFFHQAWISDIVFNLKAA